MKTVIQTIFLAIGVGLLALPSHADGEKNMALSFDPMGLLSGAVPLTFRMGIADRFSLGITAYDKFFSLSKVTTMGIGGGLSGKFHLSGTAFTNGWYVKPEAMVGYWQIGDEPNKTKGIAIEPRLTAGYDWIWPNGFNLSLGFGIKYLHFTGDRTAIKDMGFGFHEFFPNADLGLGWAF